MNKTDKIIGIIFIISAIAFIILEFITLYTAKIPLWEGYITKTVSRLAVPYGAIYLGSIDTISPNGNLLNLAFIYSAIVLLIGNIVSIRKYLSEYKIIFIVLTVLSSIGLILLAFNPTGAPDTHLIHQISAAIVFIGATFLLIFTGLGMAEPTYKKISLILGAIAFISGILFLIVNNDLEFPLRGLFERGIIYSIVVWIFITGYYLVKNKFLKKIIS